VFKTFLIGFGIVCFIIVCVRLLWYVTKTSYKKINNQLQVIENIQNMDAFRKSERTFNLNQQKIIDEIKQQRLDALKEPKPKYVYTTDELDLKYNKDTPLPTIDGIPSSNVLEIDMKKPWSQEYKDAVQVPEYNVCRHAPDGMKFCGIPAANSFTVFNL
jgi:hypothetical protein